MVQGLQNKISGKRFTRCWRKESLYEMWWNSLPYDAAILLELEGFGRGSAIRLWYTSVRSKYSDK